MNQDDILITYLSKLKNLVHNLLNINNLAAWPIFQIDFMFVLALWGVVSFWQPLNSLACSTPELPEDAVNILDYGATSNAFDDTASIQAAVDATPWGGTLYVPPGYFLINPEGGGIWLHSNMTLLLAEGAILQAIPSNKPWYSVIVVSDVENVTIAGGTIRGERYGHVGEGEWGHVLGIWSSQNIFISNVNIKDGFGDGIYIADDSDSGGFTKNVNICYVVSDNNRRAALSVVGAGGVIVDNCRFSRTNGAAPQTGIIIEPDPGQAVSNVIIRNSQIINNLGYGVYIDALEGWVGSNTIENCNIVNNGADGINIVQALETRIARNFIENNGGNYLWMAGIKLQEALDSHIERNSIRDNMKTHRRGIVIGYGESAGVRLIGNDICTLVSALALLDFSDDQKSVKDRNTYCKRNGHGNSEEFKFLPLLLK